MSTCWQTVCRHGAQVRHDAKRDSQGASLAKLLPGYMFSWAAAMTYPEDTFLRVEEGACRAVALR